MNRRIETKTSRTAETNCLIRVLSYQEKRPEYRSGDRISPVIMNDGVKLLIKIPFAREWFKKLCPFGMYEYVVARTKYIDEAFERALCDGTKQVLILGAGFDTRAVRFADKSGGVKIFELDAPVTQHAKLLRYRQKRIALPENAVFVPIDFDRQSIGERLAESGFERGKKCLFVMEGLIMYLRPESVNALFGTICALSGAGSRMVFDFVKASVVRREASYAGAEAMTKSLSKYNEEFHFGMEPEEVGAYLSKYAYQPLEVLESGAIEARYFRNVSGGLPGKVSETHCLVTATH